MAGGGLPCDGSQWLGGRGLTFPRQSLDKSSGAGHLEEEEHEVLATHSEERPLQLHSEFK